MTAAEVLRELKSLGQEKYKALLMRNHGVTEPFFGVKIGDMKPIQKRIRKDYQLALDLYASGNYDAMYLAGLVADDARMTPQDLQRWAANARCGSLPGTTVASVAAANPHGWQMGLEWIDSPKKHIAVAGWATLAGWVALKDDAELDLPALRQLVTRVSQTIHGAPDRVRYAMNSFLIALGCHVKPLTRFVLESAEKIGPVTADLGPNDCQVPSAPDFIRKVDARGSIGKKRKTLKC